MKKRRSRILSLLLALCLTAGLAVPTMAAEEAGGVTAPAVSLVEVQETSVDLGEIGLRPDTLTANGEFQITLKNTGDVTVYQRGCSSRTEGGGQNGHQISFSCWNFGNMWIEPGETTTFNVRWSITDVAADSCIDPDIRGSFSATWVLELSYAYSADGEATTREVPIQVDYELAPSFEITPSVFDLGEVTVGNASWTDGSIHGTSISTPVTVINRCDDFWLQGRYVDPYTISFLYGCSPRINGSGGAAPYVGPGNEVQFNLGFNFGAEGGVDPYGTYTVHGTINYGYGYPGSRDTRGTIELPITVTFTLVPEENTEPEEPEGEASMHVYPTMDFGTAEGLRPEERIIIVTNDGEVDLTLHQPTAEYYDLGPLSSTTLYSYGDSVEFTIRPKAGLKPGSYDETITITSDQGASASVDVSYTVAVEELAQSLSISADSMDFGAAEVGYDPPESGDILVTNTGETLISVYRSDLENFELVGWSNGQIRTGQGEGFRVRPKAGLAPGVYRETVTFRAGDAGTVSLDLSFTVVEEGQLPEPAEQPSPWAVEQVSAAIGAGLVPESLQSKYTQTATRTEFCALAVELYEKVTGKTITERATFSDTSDVNVQKMAGIGVINGIGGNKFNPNGELTREQAATILVRLADALGRPLPEGTAAFSDNASIASWALESVGRAKAGGIMDGIGNNTFSPQGAYTREQSIMTAYRLFETMQ